MKKPTLDIKQMKYLQELGLDTSNAIAYWYRIVQRRTSDDKPCMRVISDWKRTFNLDIACPAGLTIESVPAFTLDDVVELLPIYHQCYVAVSKMSCVCYKDIDTLEILRVENNITTIDAAYEMLCWVIENGYLEKNKQ